MIPKVWGERKVYPVASEEEMQKAYEEQFLPLVEQDRIRRIKLKEKQLRRLEKLKKKYDIKSVKPKPKKKEKSFQIVPREMIVPQQEFIEENIGEEESSDELDLETQAKLKSISEQEIKEDKPHVKVYEPRSEVIPYPIVPSLAEDCPTVFSIGFFEKDLPPGEGRNEMIGYREYFHTLPHYKDWRKQLSMLWRAPFELDKKKWASVQHYVEAQKFRGSKFSSQFSLDSNSALSKNPAMAKYAGSRSGRYKGELIRPPSTKMVKKFDFNKEVVKATRAKMKAHPKIAKILKDTGFACLYEDKKKARWLEQVRSEL